MKVSAWIQYFYFLRFSILCWFFLPVLAWLDFHGSTTSITRAFMAPNSAGQAFYIAFFTVSFSMVVLVTARNTCINGEERFGSAPPASMRWLLCNPGQLAVWISLILAQIPAVGVLIYIACTAHREGEKNFGVFGPQTGGSIWFCLAVGVLAAFFFWYAVSLFYYWTYTEPQAENDGETPAKPLIFPEIFFGDLQGAPRPVLARVLESPLRLLLRVTYPGFAPGPQGPLWELHFLSFVSLLGFLLLYIFLYPLTAPVPRKDDLQLGSIVAWCIALLFIASILFPMARKKNRWVIPTKIFFIALAIVLAWTFTWSAHAFAAQANAVEWSLPVLASLLVICSFSLWILAGLAFLLDRYRVPVLTSFLLILCLPKIFHFTYGEHYFLAVPRAAANLSVIPPTPAQALALRMHDPAEPLVIITATGGGIHAAAWTTEVLGRIEKEFADDPDLHSMLPAQQHYYLHDHVLLASGVSGGSVGLMSYLLEYTTKPLSFDRARMTDAAACSSIEDVAWGLEYYDFVRLFSNFWLSRHLAPPPDRNWALTEAFNRNIGGRLCIPPGEKPPSSPAPEENGKTLTLGKAAELLREQRMPAFTLNTTAVETGGRFLLSNYQIPRNFIQGSDLLPAESFLHAYGEPCDHLRHKAYADLPIATAARLSATFPYVSSASRIPRNYADFGYHFVDGGYYDNDGTGSAIEFLASALSKPDPKAPKDPCVMDDPAPSATAQASTQGKAQPRPPLAILLVEIRNGDDLDPLTNVDDYNYQTHPADAHLWSALSQISAPPGALWKAGHESVTRRNRLGLCLLETAYHDNLVIHHVVFNFDPATPSPEVKKAKTTNDLIQPLNWHLTSAELAQIRNKADDQKTEEAIENAKDWIKAVLQRETASGSRASAPDGPGEACRIAYVRDAPIEAASAGK